MTFENLKNWINNGGKLMWNDSEPIIGNDYTISFIEDLNHIDDNEDMKDFPILIQYNNGNSEAQVFLHEISKLI